MLLESGYNSCFKYSIYDKRNMRPALWDNFTQDLNGRFKIGNERHQAFTTDADYSWVYFKLPSHYLQYLQSQHTLMVLNLS